MNAFKKSVSALVLLNFAAIATPVFLAGCGGPVPSLSPQAVAAGGGSDDSGGSGSNSSSSGSTGSTPGSSGGNSSSSGSTGSTPGSSGGTANSGSSSGSSSSGSSSSSGTSSSGSSSNSGSAASGNGSSAGSGASTAAASSGALIPSGALSTRNIQKLSNWQAVYDTGTANSGSTSTGTMSLTGSPSRSGSARKFETSYKNAGGERYWVSFGADTATTHFVYDAWIYLDSSAENIANLELDMNQVLANGQTVIYGVQCDGGTGTWDYTKNSGTPRKPKDVWVHSKAPCNPRKWSVGAWHHVQMEYSRDGGGNVTYKSVWLDGVKQDLNATAPSAFALGWGSTLLTNFQVDGVGASGAVTVYLDDLTIYRW